MRRFVYFSFLLTVIVCISSRTASATVQSLNWGDFTGITMKFIDVIESSATDSLDINGDGQVNNNIYSGLYDGLYGKPQLSGDSLIFTKMAFFSTASNGASDLTDGKLGGTIQAKNNAANYIDKIRFREYGDASLSGTGTSGTYASVSNTLFVTVTEITNDPFFFPETFAVNMIMTPDGSWNLADDGSITGQLWSGDTTLNITSLLQSRGITGLATKVDFVMDNTLNTGSETNTTSYIAKKVNGLSVTPEIVPEPMTMGLLALGGLLLARKRK